MLAIPQHWRFSPLLASLQKSVGGHLTRTGTAGSGHLAKCAGCNCDFGELPTCACATADFTRQTYPSVSVTVTGTSAVFPLLANTGETCGADAVCGDITGTYVVAAGASPSCQGVTSISLLGSSNYSCHSGIYGVYINLSITMRPVTLGVDITLTTGYTLNDVPYGPGGPSVEGGGRFGRRDLFYSLSNGGLTFNDYQYINQGTCTTECNPVINRVKCYDVVTFGSETATHFEDPPGSKKNGCDLSVYSFAISIL